MSLVYEIRRHCSDLPPSLPRSRYHAPRKRPYDGASDLVMARYHPTTRVTMPELSSRASFRATSGIVAVALASQDRSRTMTTHARLRCALVTVTALVATSCDVVGTSRGGSPHVDELQPLSYVEEVRIGSLDDPDTGFSEIRGLDVAANGQVYVLESMAREVRVFSPEGRRLRTIGGPGEGPGEFQAPFQFGLIGDTLWVRDLLTQRISWFDAGGELLFETRGSGIVVETGAAGGLLRIFPGRPLPNGFVEPDLSFTAGLVGSFSVPIIRFDRLGEVVDTVGWEQREFTRGPVRVGGRDLYPPSLRPTSPVERTQGSDSIVLSWSVPAGQADGLLDIVRLDPIGDTLYHGRLRYTPLPTPTSVLDSLLTGPVSRARFFAVSEREMEDAIRSAIELPSFRPAVRRTQVGRDGTVWIELGTPSPDTAHWVLIEPDGTPRGRLGLPIRMTVEYSDGPTVWVVERDEVDVPWLVRLRVEPSGGDS